MSPVARKSFAASALDVTPGTQYLNLPLSTSLNRERLTLAPPPVLTLAHTYYSVFNRHEEAFLPDASGNVPTSVHARPRLLLLQYMIRLCFLSLDKWQDREAIENTRETSTTVYT